MHVRFCCSIWDGTGHRKEETYQMGFSLMFLFFKFDIRRIRWLFNQNKVSNSWDSRKIWLIYVVLTFISFFILHSFLPKETCSYLHRITPKLNHWQRPLMRICNGRPIALHVTKLHIKLITILPLQAKNMSSVKQSGIRSCEGNAQSLMQIILHLLIWWTRH